jgi:hypothetical protein
VVVVVAEGEGVVPQRQLSVVVVVDPDDVVVVVDDVVVDVDVVVVAGLQSSVVLDQTWLPLLQTQWHEPAHGLGGLVVDVGDVVEVVDGDETVITSAFAVFTKRSPVSSCSAVIRAQAGKDWIVSLKTRTRTQALFVSLLGTSKAFVETAGSWELSSLATVRRFQIVPVVTPRVT